MMVAVAGADVENAGDFGDLADLGLLGINSGAGLGVTMFYLFAGEGMLQFSAASSC